MIRIDHYVGQFQGLRGQLGGLPKWARMIVAIAAIPGMILLLLSMLAFAVSVLALLLLTVPVYAALRRLLVGGSPVQTERMRLDPSPGAKRVQATVVE
jgi:hypothetical protein